MRVCGAPTDRGSCDEPRWTDCRACYRHLKIDAGLFRFAWLDRDALNLSEVELTLIGLLPVSEPDPRALRGRRVLEAASRREDDEAARLRGLRYVLEIGDERLELTA